MAAAKQYVDDAAIEATLEQLIAEAQRKLSKQELYAFNERAALWALRKLEEENDNEDGSETVSGEIRAALRAQLQLRATEARSMTALADTTSVTETVLCDFFDAIRSKQTLASICNHLVRQHAMLQSMSGTAAGKENGGGGAALRAGVVAAQDDLACQVCEYVLSPIYYVYVTNGCFGGMAKPLQPPFHSKEYIS